MCATVTASRAITACDVSGRGDIESGSGVCSWTIKSSADRELLERLVGELDDDVHRQEHERHRHRRRGRRGGRRRAGSDTVGRRRGRSRLPGPRARSASCSTPTARQPICLCGGDGESAVTATDVEQRVVSAELRQREERVDQRVRRRQERAESGGVGVAPTDPFEHEPQRAHERVCPRHSGCGSCTIVQSPSVGRNTDRSSRLTRLPPGVARQRRRSTKLCPSVRATVICSAWARNESGSRTGPPIPSLEAALAEQRRDRVGVVESTRPRRERRGVDEASARVSTVTVWPRDASHATTSAASSATCFPIVAHVEAAAPSDV